MAIRVAARACGGRAGCARAAAAPGPILAGQAAAVLAGSGQFAAEVFVYGVLVSLAERPVATRSCRVGDRRRFLAVLSDPAAGGRADPCKPVVDSEMFVKGTLVDKIAGSIVNSGSMILPLSDATLFWMRSVKACRATCSSMPSRSRRSAIRLPGMEMRSSPASPSSVAATARAGSTRAARVSRSSSLTRVTTCPVHGDQATLSAERVGHIVPFIPAPPDGLHSEPQLSEKLLSRCRTSTSCRTARTAAVAAQRCGTSPARVCCRQVPSSAEKSALSGSRLSGSVTTDRIDVWLICA
jgi:hypothetical protein